ncbi:hypothetical protein C1645_839658 [Glomus cerebriforme]|uniref:Reverse transcriptase domain-containing protein n=1 Tax=Glomus cerebriforme TaxID=658196 RepID=A0A397S097_9GLOM|nr:hypothetical protein C1645_839658 [Glomus cerebriforme]
MTRENGRGLYGEKDDGQDFISNHLAFMDDINIMANNEKDIITDDNKIKSWKQICNENNRSAKGRILNWYIEVRKILTDNNQDNKLMENEFSKEVSEEMKKINDRMIEIDEIWGSYKTISECIKDEFIENKLMGNIKEDIIRIEVNSGNVECSLIILLVLMIGLTEKNNETIVIESTGASEIYKIMEKIENIKNNVTLRRKWKIQNIIYIDRLLKITEKSNIFWSLIEVKKEKPSKKNGEKDKLKSEIIDINDIEETLPLIRYRLYWNRNLVNGKIRETIKKYNKLKYIGEWLTLKVNKNIMENINTNEVDWEKTIANILNKKEGGWDITSEKDSKDRIYNIKNLIEQLPTYSIMEKRNKDIYQSKCPRCKREDETWMHLWQCEQNETTIVAIIQKEINDQIKALQEENIKINEQRWRERILTILTKRSKLIDSGYIYHEIIKGIFNRQLYEMESIREIKVKMERLITNIARSAREKIWIKRCDHVIELEKKIRSDKRKTSKNQGLTEEERNKITVEKYKKNIIINQLVNRWMGIIIETNHRHSDIWYKTNIIDIVNSLYRNY